METITITARNINGKMVYNKRFDDYDRGFYGMRITKDEYDNSKETNGTVFIDKCELPSLNIVERITYEN